MGLVITPGAGFFVARAFPKHHLILGLSLAVSVPRALKLFVQLTFGRLSSVTCSMRHRKGDSLGAGGARVVE